MDILYWFISIPGYITILKNFECCHFTIIEPVISLTFHSIWNSLGSCGISSLDGEPQMRGNDLVEAYGAQGERIHSEAEEMK